MRLFLSQLLLIVLLSGCRESGNKNTAEQSNVLAEFAINDSTKAVLIIPLDGCIGCSGKSLEFMKNHWGDPHVQYIVSSRQNKEIDIQLQKAGISSSASVIRDTKNRTTSLGLINGFPAICYLNPFVIRKMDATNLENELTILSSNIEYWKDTNSEVIELDALDIKPSCEGGMEKFYALISQNVAYPDDARKNGIEGKAMIELIINEKGDVEKISVLKDFYNCCQEDFQKLIAQSTKWTPGKKNGKNVSSRMILPIKFGLNESSKQ